MSVPRIVLAGTASGVGKTSITCAIIYSLRRRGLSVQPFKVGPDYIDPAYLSAASSNQARNLDAWLMGEDQLLASFVANSGSDVSVIEGVMGYYDGFGGDSNYASTCHVAALTKSPTLLVLDAARSARSVAATAMGFQKFSPDSGISGVILNKLGSKKHELLCRKALEGIGIPVVGAIPKDPLLSLESRHMGLSSTLEEEALKDRIGKVARTISECLDVDRIVEMLGSPGPLPKRRKNSGKPPKVTIGVALDTSFNFYYRDNLDALVREGASLRFFSPVGDKEVPECDGLYIGGGFPEILGGMLERNRPMRAAVRTLAEDGLPVYAECGGLMYLTKSITSDAANHDMVGLFDARTVMTGRMRLNYTRGTTAASLISDAPQDIRGHEFHYSGLESVPSDSRFAYTLDIGEGIMDGRDGLVGYNTLASYGHLYFDSSDYAGAFVRNCLGRSRR